MGDIQRVNSPRMLEIQEDIFSNIAKSVDKIEKEETPPIKEEQEETSVMLDSLVAVLEKQSSDTSGTNEPELDDLFESMAEMIQISDYSKKWMVRFGYIGIFVSIIYMIGGFFMLIKKPFSIKTAYGALGISIAFAIFQLVVMSFDDSTGIMTKFGSIGYIISIVIDIVLLVIIVSADKSYFTEDSIID